MKREYIVPEVQIDEYCLESNNGDLCSGVIGVTYTEPVTVTLPGTPPGTGTQPVPGTVILP